ncbi:MAG: putative ABC transporter permease [Collinsella sp.]|nr:putative ABC transporter permease [Collinsella sp.]
MMDSLARTIAAASVPEAPLSALILTGCLYAFIGWVWESTVCALLNRGRFANSGFLLGPLCPIYGVGAIACWFALRSIPGDATLFLASAVVCSVIEYAVGVLLERTVHARFWDYSTYPFNIQGRVCLYGAVLFGAGAVLICRVLQPAALGVLASLPGEAVRAAAALAALAIALDAAGSLASWRRLSGQLELLRADVADRINEGLGEVSDDLIDRVPDAILDSAATAQMRSHAINGWILTLTDAVMDALRDRVGVPAFVADGTAGLRMVARRIRAGASTLAAASPDPRLLLSKRDLRFFNAFSNLRMLPYEGVIRLTGLADRARDLFRRR